MDNKRNRLKINFIIMLIIMAVILIWLHSIDAFRQYRDLLYSLDELQVIVVTMVIIANLILSFKYKERVQDYIGNALIYGILSSIMLYGIIYADSSIIAYKDEIKYYKDIEKVQKVLTDNNIDGFYTDIIYTGDENIKIYSIDDGDTFNKEVYNIKVLGDRFMYRPNKFVLIDILNGKVLQTIDIDSLIKEMIKKYHLENKEIYVYPYNRDMVPDTSVTFTWDTGDRKKEYIIEVNYDKEHRKLIQNIIDN